MVAQRTTLNAREDALTRRGEGLERAIGPPSHLEAMLDLLLSVSRLFSERGDIEELDLDPVRLF